ncbi:metallophosphoesterase [Chitinophaga filiformis]|uniref:metallophosphoesterase n=1 Tax=Chitinophaga filiformis TaxID=104663 RepID=UPI001F318C75|nr:metallophosphoesterase [Chitinophaga filiformis]MCF6402114.1 metallophosphoesterase [Chitinophaga filiformis]
MKPKFLIISLIIFFKIYDCNAQKKNRPSEERALIQGQVPPDYKGDMIDLITFPVERITYTGDQPKSQKVKVFDKRIKHEFLIIKPLHIVGPFIGKQSRIGYQLEAGDSIEVAYESGQPVFSGRGHAKWELIRSLGSIEDSLENTVLFKALSGELKPLKSLNDYFLWNAYLNDKLSITSKLIESYKGKISDFSYSIIKEKALYDIEECRLTRFMFLTGSAVSMDSSKSEMVNRFGLTNHDLCEIYDSTMNGPAAKWLQFESPVVGDPYYLWKRLRYDALRERNKFFKDKRSDTSILGKEKVDEYVLRYKLAKRKYKGIIREEVLAFFFHYTNGVIKTIGFEPQIEEILADYYREPGFLAYKEAVREYEVERRKKQMGGRDVKFKLLDSGGISFTENDVKGKVVVIDFWFTGCKGCMQMVPALTKIENLFEEDTNVVFLSVSIDEAKDQWQKSIRQKKYTTGNGKSLYTGGEGSKHDIVSNLGVESYPSIFVMNDRGKLIPHYPKLDPRADSGRALINLVKRQLILMEDGPYVWNKPGSVEIAKINGASITSNDIKKGSSFKVSTDRFENSFMVTLKKELNEEPSSFEKADKLFVLSDIEGNFKAFRELLQSNGVIDENFSWTFGTGHLVLSGDIFDRGDQVTECLWLIYSLEEKARAQGGYVHFILGNHEIMNLQGDSRYVHEKYKRNADMLNRSIKELYNQETELGKWLRTKNVVEKIGDFLFTHGGISPEIGKLKLSLYEINSIARRYCDKSFEQFPDGAIKTVMSDSYSPFWYRGYYHGKLAHEHIDSILSYYSSSCIVTGHTVVSDTISIHYDGKVINTDTRHANGKSEALLVENKKLYRVDALGSKILLDSAGDFKREEYASF